VLYGVASVLCAVAPSIWLLIVLRLLQGIGGATGIVVAAAVVRDRHTGAAAAKYFSMLLLVTGLAPVLAPVLGGQLLRWTSWRHLRRADHRGRGAADLRRGRPARDAAQVAAPTRRHGRHDVDLGRLLSDRAFVGYVLAVGFGFGAMFAYIAGSPFVLQEIHHFSPQQYSAAFAVNAFGLVIAAQVSGRIVHRFGPRRLLGVGVTGSFVGGLLVLASVVLGGGGLVPLLAGLSSWWPASASSCPTRWRCTGQVRRGSRCGRRVRRPGAASRRCGGGAVRRGGRAGDALPMAIVITILGVGAFLSFTMLTRGDRRRTPPEEESVLVEVAVAEVENDA